MGLGRVEFANDATIELLAVDEHSNEQKSANGPAEWMPPNRSYWCAYDARFVIVLTRYRLSVTAPDKAAMNTVLAHCRPAEATKPPTHARRPRAAVNDAARTGWRKVAQ